MTASSHTTSALEVIQTTHNVLSQREEPLRIPDGVAHLLPGVGILVPEILNFRFPPIGPTLPGNSSEIDAHFSDNVPHGFELDLLVHPVPDDALQKSLKEYWRRLYLDGFQSISYASNGGLLRYYPFWILTWWDCGSHLRSRLILQLRFKFVGGMEIPGH